MFNNVSKKLKLIAKIYFWVVVAASVICAFCFGIRHEHFFYRSYTNVNALLPIFLIVGPAFGYLTSLCIYGLGQLVENTSVKEGEEETKAEPKKVMRKKSEKAKKAEEATPVSETKTGEEKPAEEEDKA